MPISHLAKAGVTKVKCIMVYKRVILWKQGLQQRTEICQVYKFSGPD